MENHYISNFLYNLDIVVPQRDNLLMSEKKFRVLIITLFIMVFLFT